MVNTRQEELEQRALQEQFRRMREAAARIVARNPENTGLQAELDAIISTYEREYPAFQTARNAARADGSLTQGRMATLRQEYFARVRARVFADLTDEQRQEREQAWQAFHREMEPVGLIESVVKNYYNSDNGGMQWGALAGAIGAGAAGFFMARTAGVSWWMVGIGTVAAIALGTWAGNKASDWISGTSPAAGGGRARGLAGDTVGMAGPAVPNPELVAARAPVSPNNDVSISNIGNFQPPAVPIAQNQRPNNMLGQQGNGGSIA